LLGAGSRLVGDLHFEGGLHLEGCVVGQISSQEGCLHVHGDIEGDINVPNVIISGRVKGQLRVSQLLELTETARVEGTIHYQRLHMMLGAQVIGDLLPLTDVESS